MYIIAIAWGYVTVLMAASEKTITAGILTFVFYGLIPCGLLLWILGSKHRNRQKNQDPSADQHVRQADGRDAQTDE